MFPPFLGNNNSPSETVSSANFDVAGGSCGIECYRDGGCKMSYNGNNGSFRSGSCVAKRFGGKCAGYPTQCNINGETSCLSGCGGGNLFYNFIFLL